LSAIQIAYTDKTIIVGDFNLELGQKGERDYTFRNNFNDMEPLLYNTTFEQIVIFSMWCTVVNGITRKFTLNHIYCSDITAVLDLQSMKPIFDDHLLIIVSYNVSNSITVNNWVRNWQCYTKEKLCLQLSQENWNFNSELVQDFWNEFENRLVTIVNDTSKKKVFVTKSCCPQFIKKKLHVRKMFH
jgi:hypothetical protein